MSTNKIEKVDFTLPYIVLNRLAICRLCSLLLLVIISIIASSSVPKPFIASRSALESSSSLKFSQGNTVGYKKDQITYQYIKNETNTYCHYKILFDNLVRINSKKEMLCCKSSRIQIYNLLKCNI